VYEYARGSTLPTKTVSVPTAGDIAVGPLALDHEGDLYIGAFSEKTGLSYLYEIAAGASEAKEVNLDDFPGDAIAFDGKDNLYACGESGDIAVYPPGATSPSRWITASQAEVFGGITATANGTLYVPSYNGRLFEIAPGASEPTNYFEVLDGAFDAAIGTL
jgi:hypothetical protein